MAIAFLGDEKADMDDGRIWEDLKQA